MPKSKEDKIVFLKQENEELKLKIQKYEQKKTKRKHAFYGNLQKIASLPRCVREVIASETTKVHQREEYRYGTHFSINLVFCSVCRVSVGCKDLCSDCCPSERNKVFRIFVCEKCTQPGQDYAILDGKEIHFKEIDSDSQLFDLFEKSSTLKDRENFEKWRWLQPNSFDLD